MSIENEIAQGYAAFAGNSMPPVSTEGMNDRDISFEEEFVPAPVVSFTEMDTKAKLMSIFQPNYNGSEF